jgi:hypothetical protein
MERLSGVFSNYGRVARLYPALLAIAPAMWTAVALHPQLINSTLGSWLTSSLAFFGGFTLFANIARSRGKAAETRLRQLWGGWPTTIVLRHSDSTVDHFTKSRYHAKLQQIVGELALPTLIDEQKDSGRADLCYGSATKRLIEQRRDPKYTLLHHENAQYGFRRNLLGLKPFGVATTFLAITIVAGILFYDAPARIHDVASILRDISDRWDLYAALGIDLLFLVMWLIIVRPEFVRQAANEYAIALFRTLDE